MSNSIPITKGTFRAPNVKLLVFTTGWLSHVVFNAGLTAYASKINIDNTSLDSLFKHVISLVQGIRNTRTACDINLITHELLKV